MFMAKPFLSFDDQIKYLEQDKALIINDHNYAKSMLQQIGYFGLISGYKTPFKNPTTQKYRDGVTFDNIVALYKFDENLRELFLKYLLQIERHIRSLLSNHFTEKYGESQAHYLNKSNYENTAKNRADIDRLVDILDNLANRNRDYPYINHQRSKYGNVPLWVLVSCLTFGSLSKFYILSTQDLRAKISKNFDGVNEKQLHQYLTVITKFRNVCAHNERLYSYHTKDAIPDTALHAKLGISKKGTEYKYGKRDLFALVISFRYLLPNDDFKKFKKSLIKIIKHYLKTSSFLTESELLSMMGFPNNWKRITRYKK
ncbi:MAG: Abi family protein [Eubacteriales bacterium]|nr:Abi family protein [Eubacteriales bacterium]